MNFILFFNPCGLVVSNPNFVKSFGDFCSEKLDNLCSLKSAFEYCVYSSVIFSGSIEGFMVFIFEINGFIRISDDVVFSSAYIDAIALPIEWPIIIGFLI